MPKRTDGEMLRYWKSELRRWKKEEDRLGVIARDNITLLNNSIKELEEKMKKKKPQATAKKKSAEENVIIVEVRKPRPNPFVDADDIYVTKNKIAVTRTKNSKAVRGFTKTTQTKYYEQNDSNLKLLKKAHGDAVRVGRKGTQIKRI